jgi:uncharacterized protein (DUF1501 family)
MPPTLTRRSFLQAAAAAGGAAVLPAWLVEAAGAAAPIGPGDGVLVLITMDGGNDGLNTVIPVNDGTYHDQRRSLAIPASTALPLSGERGLHPNLAAIEALWQTGDVAVIEGVGAPGSTDLSHFSSMARWQAGVTGSGGPHSGWLGRYLDGLGGGDDPFHGVSIGTSIPLVMQGRQRRATGLPVSSGVMAVAGVDATYRRHHAGLEAFAGSPTGLGELADGVAAAGHQAVGVAAAIEPVYAEDLPGGELAGQLDLCARLINANLGIRVLSVSYQDFDSHANQLAMHGARMAELSAGIGAFYRRLAPSFGARTLLLTVSEFGRRLKANASGGTDHGAASTLLAIGTQVKGGLYGQLPSLQALDAQGNLVPTVDFRSVYATVLEGWLGADSNEILGGRYENLGFVAPPAQARTTLGLNPMLVGNTFKHRAQVVRLYLACLGRLPDSRGLDHWVGARRAGIGLITVADSLISAAEAQARFGHLGNRAFVEQLYRGLLGREPDGEGVEHWTAALDRGAASRGSVVVGFSESAEFVAATTADVERVDGSGPVARLYLAYFDRPGDTQGIRYWIATGLPYAAVSDHFAASAEFAQRYGSLSDTEFVERAYRNVFDRPAGAAGRDHWLSQLARGLSRGQVMLELSESAEFIIKTQTLA